jgi:hypothetical protein
MEVAQRVHVLLVMVDVERGGALEHLSFDSVADVDDGDGDGDGGEDDELDSSRRHSQFMGAGDGDLGW